MGFYEDAYERYKQTGIRPAAVFGPPVPCITEEFRFVFYGERGGHQYSDRYKVSNYGNVIDITTGCEVNQMINSEGAHSVSLSLFGTFFVHRLVLLTFLFIPGCDSLQVNHINGNRHDNHIWNLEWTTGKENSCHAMLYGLHQMDATDNPNNKLTEQQVHEICQLIQTGQYYDTEIAQMYNVSYVNISDIHKGKIWRSISKNYDLSNRKPLALTESQVREICEMLQTGKYRISDIADKYNVSRPAIGAIYHRECWTHISKDYEFKIPPRKFSKEQVREICEVMQTEQYYDKEIAEMFGTTSYFIYSLRNGKIHTDVTKDYDMTKRKYYYYNSAK